MARIDEAPFVRLLLENSVSRADLFGIKGMPRAPIAFQNVPYPTGAGDIDILVCADDHPDLAVAVQVKVIRFAKGPAFDGIHPPNGLQNLAKGVQQANDTIGFGFARVYLYIFVAVDARLLNAGKGVTFEGLPADRDADVDDAIRAVARNALDPRVILVRFDFEQTMDDPPLTTGSGGTHLIAPVPIPDDPLVQPPELTQWVARRLAERSKYEVRPSVGDRGAGEG